jgi:3-oxoacyl-(acyl-carrier-protein) synthase
MIAEILYYNYITDWNIENLLDPEFNNHVTSDYPLLVSSHSGRISEQSLHDAFYVKHKRRGSPRELRNAQQDSLMSLVASTYGLQREVVRLQAECTGSLYTFYMASILSQAKNTPVVVFCADNIPSNDYNTWMFNSVGAVDQEGGRPFDDSSKGFKMGVGGALFLIKHPSVKHPLPPMATISNFKFYTNPDLITNPGSVDDIIKNIGDFDFSKIDLWNAHATGTPVGDRAEYDFFQRSINRDIPIVGYKGYVGHCFGASGAIEISMLLDDYKNNSLRPNHIIGNKIVDDSRIITEPTSFTYRRVVKSSLGFGGKTVLCEVTLL